MMSGSRVGVSSDMEPGLGTDFPEKSVHVLVRNSSTERSRHDTLHTTERRSLDEGKSPCVSPKQSAER